MAHNHKHCREFPDRMAAYLDGELDQEIIEQVEKHIKECNPCKECLQSVRKVKQILQSSPKPDIPEDIKTRLKDCLKNR